MIRINLLPHREEKRKFRRQQFYAFLGAAVVAGLAVWFVGHGIFSGYISNQDDRNNFLKTEIAALDKEIDEIKRLREQTEALLARKRVIESLQGGRSEAVSMLNELARSVPEGIYLKSMRQQDAKITVIGYAQSNARVSTLMRNIESSTLLEKPSLVEIKAATVNGRRMSEFNLNFNIKRATAEAQGSVPSGGKARAA